MKEAGTALILISLLYYGTVHLSPISVWKGEATALLQSRHGTLDRTLNQADREMTLPAGGIEELDRMRRDRSWISLELKRRQWRLKVWMPAVAAVGLALFLVSWIPVPGRAKGRKPEGAPEPGEVEGVHVWPPREVYADEWEFGRRQEGSFASREEAVSWLRKDPLKRCDYCGAEMKPLAGGPREGIELVTFYKKVPEGARDLRVVLGSFWFVKAAPELKCEGCERVVRR